MPINLALTDPKRAPDYDLSLRNKVTGEHIYRIGSAWINPDATVSVQLNRFVTVPTEPEWIMTLSPRPKHLTEE